MQKKKDGYFISSEEYNYIFSVISLMRDNNAKSSGSIESALEECEYTPELVNYSSTAKALNNMNILLLDTLRNIFGGENLFDSRSGSYDIVEYVERYIENINSEIDKMAFFTNFELRKKFSCKKEIVFNEYKMRSIILNLLALSSGKKNTKSSVIYLRDNGDKDIRLSIVTDRNVSYEETPDNYENTSDELKAAAALKLRNYGGLLTLRRFASEMGGELVVEPFRGKTRYTAVIPKKFSTRTLRESAPRIQFSILEIRRFFGVISSLAECGKTEDI